MKIKVIKTPAATYFMASNYFTAQSIDFRPKARQTASMKATAALNELSDDWVRVYSTIFEDLGLNRNRCIDCGAYTVYSPYACERHADKNGGDGGDD